MIFVGGVGVCCATQADRLYLFCTWIAGFCRFLPIEPIEFSKSFENLKIVADRLPPPPPLSLGNRQIQGRFPAVSRFR